MTMTASPLAYAGIGSRSTPPAFRPVMADIARRLARLGWTLRSGRAAGADSFFEEGAGARAELFLAKGREGRTPAGARVIVPSGAILDRCSLLASVAHPNWGACSEYARLLHSRNVCQIHGERLTSPVRFVVAWAQPGLGGSITDGTVTGGTGLAWRIAGAARIRRFNLAVAEDDAAFGEFLRKLEAAA